MLIEDPVRTLNKNFSSTAFFQLWFYPIDLDGPSLLHQAKVETLVIHLSLYRFEWLIEKLNPPHTTIQVTLFPHQLYQFPTLIVHKAQHKRKVLESFISLNS